MLLQGSFIQPQAWTPICMEKEKKIDYGNKQMPQQTCNPEPAKRFLEVCTSKLGCGYTGKSTGEIQLAKFGRSFGWRKHMTVLSKK